MTKRMTIQLAVEEFELYHLYNDIIESYGENLEDPDLVSDLYHLIEEDEEEFDFSPDSEGDYSESFERNLIDTIITLVEESEDMSFTDDFSDDEDIPEIYDDEFEKESEKFGLEFSDDEGPGNIY